jgi:hypothetical protein
LKNVITEIKLRKMRWVGLKTYRRDACKILVSKPEGKSHLVDLGMDGSY